MSAPTPDTDIRKLQRRLDRQFDAVRSMPPPVSPVERYRIGVEDLRRGGYFRIREVVYRVEAVSEYREKKECWHELECLAIQSGTTVFIEWEKDDEVEVSLNGPPLPLRELGVTPDQIEAMSDEERGSIRHGGKAFHYDDDYAATYHRDGGTEGERVYFYDFETKDEQWGLSVEEWGSKQDGFEYQAYVSEYLPADAVEVLVVGDA